MLFLAALLQLDRLGEFGIEYVERTIRMGGGYGLRGNHGRASPGLEVLKGGAKKRRCYLQKAAL
jgi:hypothetical protein